MKTKTINLYQFEELTPEQQGEVIEKYNDINDDSFDFFINEHKQPIHDKGFLKPELHYSLSYSQGDGACFECEQFDFDLLLKDWDYIHKKWIIDILKDIKCVIKPNQFGYHYSHENSRDFIVDYYSDVANYERISKMLEQAQEHIEEIRYNACVELTRALYDELEYLRSNDAIKETLIANEYYFNGETLEIED